MGWGVSDRIIPEQGQEGFDAGDARHVRRARDVEKREEKQRAAVIIGLMDLPEGRKWLWDFLAACGLYETPFSESELRMAYNAGRGDVGRRLLADIVQFSPDMYVEMIKEHQRK